MNRRNFILILFLLLSINGCTKNKSPLIYENASLKLRIINVTKYPGSIDVYGNHLKLIDSLLCNRSSGYLNINFDSLKITVFDSNDRINSIYDTLIFLSKEKFYTLILFKKDENVYSYLVEDPKISSGESAWIRIFNNSKAGEPFIFSLRSVTDTISFTAPPLFKMSSYKILRDTSYIPSLEVISNGISGDYQKIALEKGKHYTIIITDTFIPIDSRYPYLIYLFVDIFDNKNNSGL